jgi:hypothetical protein
LNQDLKDLIDQNFSELFSKHQFELIHESQTNIGAVQEYHHEHLVLIVSIESGHAQLLVGSQISRRDMWPIPLLLDTLNPSESMPSLPQISDQVKDLVNHWTDISSMMSPESFPITREKVLKQLRSYSEKMFNFSGLT